VGTPGRLSIHGLSATPDGSSIIKNTAGSKALLSAIWPRKGKEALYRATLQVYHYQDSDWPSRLPLQFTGHRQAPLAALKFEMFIPGNALRYHYVNRVGLGATQRKRGVRQRRRTAAKIDRRANLASFVGLKAQGPWHHGHRLALHVGRASVHRACRR
jgi:hypothetical protein